MTASPNLTQLKYTVFQFPEAFMLDKPDHVTVAAQKQINKPSFDASI